MIQRKRVLFEEVDEGPEWVVVFHMGLQEFDDDLEESDLREVILNAPDFDLAAKYAQQYLRKMQTEEETAEEWQNAEILSVEIH